MLQRLKKTKKTASRYTGPLTRKGVATSTWSIRIVTTIPDGKALLTLYRHRTLALGMCIAMDPRTH